MTAPALYSLVHREYGPISTFPTLLEAARELAHVLRDEPEWADDLSPEGFELRVAEPSER